MCTAKKKLHAQIVIAGDPKQLGAVSMSVVGKKLGYTVSWLERLCEYQLYSKRSDGNFDTRYITQLVKNYRSHPEILRVSNELFYDNTLQPVTEESKFTKVNNFTRPLVQFYVLFR